MSRRFSVSFRSLRFALVSLTNDERCGMNLCALCERRNRVVPFFFFYSLMISIIMVMYFSNPLVVQRYKVFHDELYWKNMETIGNNFLKICWV